MDFDEFFADPYVDLEHSPSPDALPKAVSVIKVFCGSKMSFFSVIVWDWKWNYCVWRDEHPPCFPKIRLEWEFSA